MGGDNVDNGGDNSQKQKGADREDRTDAQLIGADALLVELKQKHSTYIQMYDGASERRKPEFLQLLTQTELQTTEVQRQRTKLIEMNCRRPKPPVVSRMKPVVASVFVLNAIIMCICVVMVIADKSVLSDTTFVCVLVSSACALVASFFTMISWRFYK